MTFRCHFAVGKDRQEPAQPLHVCPRVLPGLTHLLFFEWFNETKRETAQSMAGFLAAADDLGLGPGHVVRLVNLVSRRWIRAKWSPFIP